MLESDLQNLCLRYTDDWLEAEDRRAFPIESLIEQLRLPANRVSDKFSCVIPGGECLTFSITLRALIFRPGLAHRSSSESMTQ